MSDVSPGPLKLAVETQHRCKATLFQTVRVHETFEGKTVWEGIAHIFNIFGHLEATRAFAWTSELEDGTRLFQAVLHIQPVTGPREAVRAAIAAERKGQS